jgi:hypothetical protein
MPDPIPPPVSPAHTGDRTAPLVYYLHAAAALAPAAEEAYPKEVNGQPAAYFWADAIRVGRYVHPAGHFELSVDEQRLDAWAANFRRMRDAGVDVPVPVDHSTSARDNLGYVIDAKRDGDRLCLLHQLIGEDAIALAARNKVSLAIDPRFRDGHGTPYGDCIVHSSLTPIPVVPGQAGFVPMSRGGDDGATAMVFTLAPAKPPSDPSADFRRRAESLVKAGRITPACRDRLLHCFARDRPADWLTLSREGNPGVAGLADELLDALSHNQAIPLGERTGLQALGRLTPRDEPPVNADLQSRMARMASGR